MRSVLEWYELCWHGHVLSDWAGGRGRAELGRQATVMWRLVRSSDPIRTVQSRTDRFDTATVSSVTGDCLARCHTLVRDRP